MTKENFTSINVIIDESGSMGHLATDTIGGFNQFLSEQKVVPGDAVLTLCTFNSDYRLVHEFLPLSTIPDLDVKTYRPGGSTALLDAMGTTINSVGSKLASLQEHERPSKVIFLIITDGEENCSHRFSRDQIKSMVTHQQDVYSWEFVFMGANIDSIAAGTSMGITMQNTLDYDATPAATRGLYSTISENMTSYRGSQGPRANFFDQNMPPILPVIKDKK